MTEAAPTSDANRPALRPANDNPWYCLATLHGEQPTEGLDQVLADRNYTAWNQWIVLGPTDTGMLAQYASDFAQRTSLRLPEPGTSPDFSHTHFDRSVNFANFQFSSRPVDFRSAKFSGEANFRAAQFFKVNFSSAAFAADAIFLSAGFNGVEFQSATFSGRADFQSAGFNDANFGSANFIGDANFRSTRFSGTADFPSVTFSSTADFASANFNGVANFDSATFSEPTNFRSVKFFDEANFNGATFSSSTRFINAKFAGNTIFANARFGSQVPDFRGAELHEATEWHGVAWPKPPGSKVDAQQQVYAYERLKQEMERQKKHEDEQNFFRRELRARRGLVRVLSGGWLLNAVYQALSDYGDSTIRPLLWLSGVFAVGAAFFGLAPVYCGAPMPIERAAWLSFANIFLFLPTKREIMTDMMVGCLTSTAQVVGAVQSLLAVVLLFLLGLALRNRFRMK